MRLEYAAPLELVKGREASFDLNSAAERLGRVVNDEAASDAGMGECPCCGSTIARYARTCPFCRHPLTGPLGRFARG